MTTAHAPSSDASASCVRHSARFLGLLSYTKMSPYVFNTRQGGHLMKSMQMEHGRNGSIFFLSLAMSYLPSGSLYLTGK